LKKKQFNNIFAVVQGKVWSADSLRIGHELLKKQLNKCCCCCREHSGPLTAFVSAIGSYALLKKKQFNNIYWLCRERSGPLTALRSSHWQL
jgi:hypothetical protein